MTDQKNGSLNSDPMAVVVSGCHVFKSRLCQKFGLISSVKKSRFKFPTKKKRCPNALLIIMCSTVGKVIFQVLGDRFMKSETKKKCNYH
ncbi:hypothetical protein DERF_008696 [Dermatophagoides farinae]|uniref:Uncharacterized protein n=1 Tax=Dermatophagoides farinae TaxID=6954 RepID=A0A922L785_DERFA|nr:hypothetical protein DERF_008696 [Dermatophagoides farinae]